MILARSMTTMQTIITFIQELAIEELNGCGIIYIKCGKKFVAFFPLDGIKKTPQTFFHS